MTNQIDYPTAGDAVRLTDTWPWASTILRVGAIGIIGGTVGAQMPWLHITWHYSAFRGFSMNGCIEHDFRNERISRELGIWQDNPGMFVSCSGGPATIALPADLLKPTGELTRAHFWCWSGWPRAHSGYYYNLDVPMWDWNGKGYE